MQKAVSRRRFANTLSQLDDLPIRQDNCHCHHVVSRDAVLDSFHSSRIGADVSADRCRLLPGIRGVHHAMCKRICSQIAQQYTRLDPDAEILHVIL